MSKTETQSKAESLAKMLEFGAFSPNLLQNEIGVRKGAADELRRLDAENKQLNVALDEWLEKTHWVQETAQALELGMHRADVLRARIDALDAENKALRARLEIDPSHPIDGIEARDETIRLLEGQILALRADAERYRWLRRNVGVYRTNDGRGPVSPYLLSRPPAADAIAEETDIAIDAAMAAAKTGDAA